MSAWESRVHFDRDGRPWCGHPVAREATADREQVTCGTPAAYRRHLRREGKPVRCKRCLAAEQRRYQDRKELAA